MSRKTTITNVGHQVNFQMSLELIITLIAWNKCECERPTVSALVCSSLLQNSGISNGCICFLILPCCVPLGVGLDLCSSLGPSRWCWSPHRCPDQEHGPLGGPRASQVRYRSWRRLCCCSNLHSLLLQRRGAERWTHTLEVPPQPSCHVTVHALLFGLCVCWEFLK